MVSVRLAALLAALDFQISAGRFRRVVLVGRFAIKIPHARNPLAGMRCNRWEREVWRTWRPKFRWENLCPIRLADRAGFVVVMARAMQSVAAVEIEAADPDCYPDIDVEYKPENWRLLNGRVVAIDYGLWDAGTVRERRAYYGSMPGPARCNRARV